MLQYEPKKDPQGRHPGRELMKTYCTFGKKIRNHGVRVVTIDDSFAGATQSPESGY